MNRIVRIGGPPHIDSQPLMCQAVTIRDVWKFVGLITTIGTVIYIVEGDPGGLIAAVIIGFLLFQVNRND